MRHNRFQPHSDLDASCVEEEELPQEKIGGTQMLIQNATQWYISAVEYVKTVLDRDEEGQGMIEDGLLVALISIAALAVIVLIGPKLTGIFGNVYNAL
jgi:pilus assembly protein Flp/PilA